MCGRYVQTKVARYRARLLELAREAEPARAESWNVAPTTLALAVRLMPPPATSRGPGTPPARALPGSPLRSGTTGSAASQPGDRVADWLTWGLQGPGAARDSGAGTTAPGEGAPLRPINARIESVAERPFFREPWKSRRCLIPADGWYEWKAEADLPRSNPSGRGRARGRAGTRKQPYYFHRRDGLPLFLAALWTGDTYCLITTPADGHLTQIHDRRPLTLRDDLAAAWLTHAPASADQALAAAIPPDAIAFHPVSPQVSNARQDGPELIDPISLDPASEFLPGF